MNWTLTFVSYFLAVFSIYVPMKISVYFPDYFDLIVFNRCIGNLNYVEKDGEILNITRISPGLDFLYYDCGKEYYCFLSGFTNNETSINLKIYVSNIDTSKCYTCINKPQNSNSQLSIIFSFLLCVLAFLIIAVTALVCLYMSKKNKSEYQYLTEKCCKSQEYDPVSIIDDENL
jgi:hypothetical protein